MFRYVTLAFLIVASVSAKPQLIAPLAYSAPFVASPIASGALISREFHGNTSPYVAAVPYTAAAYTDAYFPASPYAAPYAYPI